MSWNRSRTAHRPIFRTSSHFEVLKVGSTPGCIGTPTALSFWFGNDAKIKEEAEGGGGSDTSWVYGGITCLRFPIPEGFLVGAVSHFFLDHRASLGAKGVEKYKHNEETYDPNYE